MIIIGEKINGFIPKTLKAIEAKDAEYIKTIAMGQDEDFNISTSIVTVIKLKKIGCKKITVRLDDDKI